jgi:hypothetical protein
MLAQTNASYIEKNMNSKMGVKRAMLVDTNKTITMRRFRMIPTKRAIKGLRVGAHGCGEQWNARDMRLYTGLGLREDKTPMTCVCWLYYDSLG